MARVCPQRHRKQTNKKKNKMRRASLCDLQTSYQPSYTKGCLPVLQAVNKTTPEGAQRLSSRVLGMEAYRRIFTARYTSFSTQHSHLMRGFASFPVRIHTPIGSQGRHIALLATYTRHVAISQTVCS